MKIAVFNFALFGINTYVVYDPASKECAIVDPGMMLPEEQEAIREFVRKNSLKVTNIINTHLHIDHAIGVDYAADTFKSPVLAHKDDIPLAKNIKGQAEMFGLPFDVKEPVVTQYLEDGDTVKIGDGELHVLHVPGHSPGSIVLYDKEEGFLIAGDVLFQGSIGRTDLPGGNHAQLIRGIREKLLPLPDPTVVYPGHGPSTTIGAERRSNPFLP